MRRLLAGLAAVVVLVAGCSAATPEPTSGASRHGDRTATAPADTREPASGSTLDAGEFKAAIEQPGTVVLDVRTAEEFASGHLADARNIDVNGNFAGDIGALDKGVSYAIYCRSGNRSATAMKLMQDAGFSHVFHLGGGIGAWQAAGYEVVTR